MRRDTQDGRVKLGKHMLQVQNYSWTDLFDLVEKKPWPGNPSPFDSVIRFKHLDDTASFAGPGIYALFFDEGLIYIGKYRGRKNNPFSGDVSRFRWDKHLGTFTMRGRNVSLPPTVLERVLATFSGDLIDQIGRGAPETIERDRGMVAGFKRVRFALENWQAFSRLDKETLARFTAVYVRVLPSPDLSAGNTEEIRAAVSAAETTLIREFLPVCNNESDRTYPYEAIPASLVDGRIQEVLRKALLRGEDPESAGRLRPEGGRDGGNHPSSEGMSVSPDDFDRNEERFLDVLDPWARGFVGQLRECCDTRSDDLEVYFTAAGGADLRIRYSVPDRRARTLLTMKWQPRSQRLRCEVLADVAACRQCGFGPDQIASSTDSVMLSRLDLHSGRDQLDELMALLDRAARALTVPVL
ncbi:hypothetical protein JL100_015170 [Skermanella mucosa]|uniref:hypothetical protein n=1 Tax=Skermanella mucosa TaxID=1789672 RepID=UPI00192AE698|nr:hypothetical protein [Skermanella mucosa]UEM18461.1 hypothetical protein JL100_015170 [Skermanella mucosa]